MAEAASIDGIDFFGSKCTNRIIPSILLKDFYPNAVQRACVLKDFQAKEVKKKKKLRYIPLALPPKVKEISFKILHSIYPTNDFLRQKLNFGPNNCGFCEKETETLEHLFFNVVMCAHSGVRCNVGCNPKMLFYHR